MLGARPLGIEVSDVCIIVVEIVKVQCLVTTMLEISNTIEVQYKLIQAINTFLSRSIARSLK